MTAFSDTNINKLVSVSLLIGLLTYYTLSGFFHFPVNPTVDVITGIALGYSSHALGVVNGAQAANGGAAKEIASVQPTDQGVIK